jgi:hypothetical protein
MTVVLFAAKTALAVLLLIAGGAKLADLAGFGAAIRIFVPAGLPAGIAGRVTAAAAAIAATELAAGAVSLCWPALRWMNLAVLALACAFAAVAILGYARHRGRPCRCFGALTRRELGLRNIAQALLILAVAVLATRPVPPGRLQLGLTAHLLLVAAASIVAAAAFTAAKALLASDGIPLAQARPGMAG